MNARSRGATRNLQPGRNPRRRHERTRNVRSRFSRGVELRAADSGDGYTLTGYASVFDTAYPVRDSLGEYAETVRHGAFTRSLQQRDDVRLLLNHEGVPLARTKSGNPDPDPRRGWAALRSGARCWLTAGRVDQIGDGPRRPRPNEFAFQATRQEWNDDYSQRTIVEAKLFDVSVVTYPASPTTSASLRAAADGDANPRAAAVCERAAREFRAGKEIDGDVRDLLLQALGAIDAGTEIVEDAADVIEAALGLSPLSDPTTWAKPNRHHQRFLDAAGAARRRARPVTTDPGTQPGYSTCHTPELAPERLSATTQATTCHGLPHRSPLTER